MKKNNVQKLLNNVELKIKTRMQISQVKKALLENKDHVMGFAKINKSYFPKNV